MLAAPVVNLASILQDALGGPGHLEESVLALTFVPILGVNTDLVAVGNPKRALIHWLAPEAVADEPSWALAQMAPEGVEASGGLLGGVGVCPTPVVLPSALVGLHRVR